MLGHEYFEEIAAAASRGEATAEELTAFGEHARECAWCRTQYADDLHFAAREFAVSREHGLAAKGVAAAADVASERLTAQFLERIARGDLPVPASVADDEIPAAVPGTFAPSWWTPALRLAAMLIIGVGLGVATMVWRQGGNSTNPPVAPQAAPDTRQARIDELSSELEKSRTELRSTAGDLATARARDQQAEEQYRELEGRVAALQSTLTKAQADMVAAQQDAERLRVRATTAETTLATAQARVNELQPAAEDARAARERARVAEANLLEARATVSDLNTQIQASNDALERQRQLMALGRDVTDLMGARNLHIVDVVDTDPEGKDRKAFGRVFFTENKSLVFYAFDLNEARLQRAAYEYRVWARKEAEPQRAQSLGIFYSDSQTLRRWVFKCSDPKILSEIDSVFVTLERKDSKPTNPRGTQLLYAYLRGQPNHY